MAINNLLLKPAINRMVEEYMQLHHEILEHESNQFEELQKIVQEKMEHLKDFEKVDDLKSDRDFLREEKLELRFVQRRWKRACILGDRTKRKQEALKSYNS